MESHITTIEKIDLCKKRRVSKSTHKKKKKIQSEDSILKRGKMQNGPIQDNYITKKQII
jgi:hypothetical protein